MNERNNASPPANIGISLLLSVFLVLCLFTFSAIALVQAENEWHHAEMTRDAHKAYYSATNLAEEELHELNASLADGQSVTEKNIHRQYDMRDNRALSVELTYLPTQNRYTFSEFKTISTKTWEGDDSVNVIH